MAQILRQEIERQGVIPFARFMRQCLYHPEHGYYERTAQVIGRRGDYYTSASTGTLFGELLAFQFTQWLAQLSSRPLHLVEAGAHDGSLAAAILAWIGEHKPAVLEDLEYWIIEPSVQRQTWQRRKVENFAGNVHWSASFDSLRQTGINGVIFSNELLDAMPVRRIGWDAQRGAWFEWGVALEKGRFAWARLADERNELAAEFKDAGLDLPPSLLEVLPDGFTVDLCSEAAAWWRAAAMALRCGRLLTLDYGLTAEQFMAPERAEGTLRGYYRHHLSADPLAHPGEQDLTAHVNFTQLQMAGETAGLRTEGFYSQEQFLIGVAARLWRDESLSAPWTASQTRQFQTLTGPEHLGRAFKVLIQSRS